MESKRRLVILSFQAKYRASIYYLNHPAAVVYNEWLIMRELIDIVSTDGALLFCPIIPPTNFFVS